MAKRLVSINLDEELLDEMDALCGKVGMSRSAFVNLTMRGVVMGETADTTKLLLTTALAVKNAGKVATADSANGAAVSVSG